MIWYDVTHEAVPLPDFDDSALHASCAVPL